MSFFYYVFFILVTFGIPALLLMNAKGFEIQTVCAQAKNSSDDNLRIAKCLRIAAGIVFIALLLCDGVFLKNILALS